MKVPGVPYQPGKHPRARLNPTAVVLHRTYGSWPGDYAIGRNGRGGEPIGFHFLIGKNEGEWVQFYDTSVVCNHAAGANSWAVGIEISGRNEDPLTAWQRRALRVILDAVLPAHGIPRTYTTAGRRRKINGCLPHSLVPGSDHTDLVTEAGWAATMGAPTGPPASWGDTARTNLTQLLEDNVPAYFLVTDDPTTKGDLPKGAVIRVTADTWAHLTPDDWSVEQELFGAKQPQPINQPKARSIQRTRLAGTAL